MKYNQPYGVSDPEAAYINGNPSTGTMGSIPPAASIEHPQREIVNLIKNTKNGDGSAFAAPSPGDLLQLARCIQSGLLIYARDSGVANVVRLNISPAINQYWEGLTVLARILYANTGPAMLDINTRGAKNIVHRDGSTLVGGELIPGGMHCFVYNGVEFELAWSNVIAGIPVYLTRSTDFYVNSVSGSDTVYDGTAASYSGVGTAGPFKTLQRASLECGKYNLNNYNITIHVANGTYAPVGLYRAAGTGRIYWTGDPSNPQNVIIDGGAYSCIVGSEAGSAHHFEGFRLVSAGTPAVGSAMCGVFVQVDTTVHLNNIEFGQCLGAHMCAASGGNIQLGSGFIRCTAGSAGFALGAGLHAIASGQASITMSSSAPPILILTNTCTFGRGWAQCSRNSYMALWYGSITGGAFGTGVRYSVNTTSILEVGGHGDLYYPGTLPGEVSSQGLYY